MEFLKGMENLPSDISAHGWIPFTVAIVLTFIFSAAYVRYFWSRNEQDKCSGISATLGITTALLAAFLLPVDIFLISSMKQEDGQFENWATNETRQATERTIMYTYYSLWGIMFFIAFAILPFVYFAYEEQDEDERNNGNVRF